MEPMITSSTPLASGASATSGADQIRSGNAAREFEAMVIAQMLAPLFQSVETPGVAGGGAGEDVFSALLVEEYGRVIADAGGFGIADAVKASLIDLQADNTRGGLINNNERQRAQQ